MRFKNFRLMAPAGEADGGGGDAEDVVTLDDKDGVDQGEDEHDRGDALEAPLDAKDLKKVAGEEDPPGEPAKNKGSQHVPIGRFNEVNEAKKALEREVADLKAKQAAPEPEKQKEPPKFDEDAAELDYANLLSTGEVDKAVAKRKEINAHLKSEARREAEEHVERNREQRETVSSLTQVAEQAVKDWPYLDTDDGAETMELIIAARHGFEAKGMPAAQALKKAVDQIAPKYAPDTPGKASTDAGGKKDTREQQANARGAEASNRQPPRLDGGAGNRTQGAKVDVENLDDDQFNALPAAEKRKLRGDDA